MIRTNHLLKSVGAFLSLRNLIFLIGFTISAGILSVAVTSALFPAATKFSLFASPILIFFLAVLFIGVLFRLVEMRVSERYTKRYPWIVASIFTFNIVVIVVAAIALKSTGYTWDYNIVYSQAVAYANNGMIDDSFIGYFVASANNITLLALLGGMFSFAKSIGVTDFLTIAVGVNVVILILTQVLIYKCSRMLYGRRIALLSLVFSFVFLSLSLYVQIPYTDTLTIIFPILIFYLGLNIVRARTLWVRIVLAVCIGMIGLLGYSLKPTVLIAVMALAIAGVSTILIVKKSGPLMVRIGRAAIILLGFSTGFVGSYVALDAYIDSLHVVPYPIAKAGENSLPALHFVNIGMKTNRSGNVTYYGGYDDATVQAVADLPTKSSKVEYSIEGIKRQLRDYGPIGYAQFLLLKLNWITSDGTFYAYGEGSNQNVAFTSHTKLSQVIREFLYYQGRFYGYFANVLQISWISLLLLIGAQVYVLFVSKASRQNLYLLAPRLMVAAIITFLLLFEGRSRYLYLYLPIFIVLSMYTLVWLRSALKAPRVAS